MRRHGPPYNSKKFLLNTNTGEIHDLDQETDQCCIAKINPEHVHMEDTYMGCLIYAKIHGISVSDGCFYCLADENRR